MLLLASAMAFGQDAVFRVESRLVEVYATIRDRGGRYVDNLAADQFDVRDNGVAQSLVAFESNSLRLSCAILLDTTGSMAEALPTVKNSVIKLMDALRDEDAVAVYAFRQRHDPPPGFHRGQSGGQAGCSSHPSRRNHGIVRRDF